MSDITYTMHDTTVVEGYLDDDDAETMLERARVYNRARPFHKAIITFLNHGFNLGSWQDGNPNAEIAREKYRIVYPQIINFAHNEE